MRPLFVAVAAGLALLASIGFAQHSDSAGPYKLLKKVQIGGDGGFDYTSSDVDGRRLYIARSGPSGRIGVFNLDTIEKVGELTGFSSHGAALDHKSNHGFASSKPITMFDLKTLATMKTIEVQGNPDGMLFDAFNQHVYVFSHAVPHVTVIDSKDGTVLGTIDLGGMPEQGVSDGKGHIYIDVEDKGNVAVVDAKTMKVTAHYDLAGKGDTCAGLAMDVKNRILFAACRNPRGMVILNADDGKIIDTLPIGAGSDGAVFNPNTMEAFSSNTDGTLTVIKENSPTSFVVEQNLQTQPTAKTMTLDTKTNRIVLITAAFGPPPADPPPGRPARGPMVPDSFTILVVGK